MNRKKALEILRNGHDGVAEWNCLRRTNSEVAKINLAGSDLRVCDLKGVNLSGIFLRGANLNGSNLHGADLGSACLADAMFLMAKLPGANLSRANLDFANFTEADLCGARLVGADLCGARLVGADLRGANLSRAHLGTANLTAAKLQEANLSYARVESVVLCGIDLSGTKGLDKAVVFRSWLGLDTVLKSGGKIPNDFLRRCGVDPRLQEIIWRGYLALELPPNPTASPRPYQSCFISFSTKDKPFVDRLQKALEGRGVQCWYAPKHGQWGKRLTTQFEQQIVRHDRVLLVCSEASLKDSDWVQWELEKALSDKRGLDGAKGLIFPITIDDAIFEWSHPRATRIRDTLVGDFRGATKGIAFSRRLARLMDALAIDHINGFSA